MARYGKPDATGRSSGRYAGKKGPKLKPPRGEPWAWHTLGVMTSPAWQAMSINARRVLDRIEIEHLEHAGQENGVLIITHKNFYAYGVSRDAIAPAINELKFLGLIKFTRGGRWGGTNKPSVFTLTLYGDRDGRPPTNDWKRVTSEQIRKWKDNQKQIRAKKNEAKSEKKRNPDPTFRDIESPDTRGTTAPESRSTAEKTAGKPSFSLPRESVDLSISTPAPVFTGAADRLSRSAAPPRRIFNQQPDNTEIEENDKKHSDA